MGCLRDAHFEEDQKHQQRHSRVIVVVVAVVDIEENALWLLRSRLNQEDSAHQHHRRKMDCKVIAVLVVAVVDEVNVLDRSSSMAMMKMNQPFRLHFHSRRSKMILFDS